MSDLSKTGVAILLIEQHLRLVREISDRYYVISKGAIIETGNMKEVDQGRLQASIMH